MYECLFLGNHTIALKEVTSTNDFAAELIKNQHALITDGTVVFAENQTNGKGQRGSVWLSQPNENLTFSVVLKPSLLVDEQFLLSKIVALGIFDFLTNRGIKNVAIKWPNDIYVNNKKIAGMLLENILRNSKIEYCIAGIGLNVNQVEFPKDLSHAISLQQITNQPYDLASLLKEVLFFIEKRYMQLKSGKLTVLNQDYLKQMLGYQKENSFIIHQQKVSGKIVGVDKSGRLQVAINQHIQSFDLKTIQFCLEE